MSSEWFNQDTRLGNGEGSRGAIGEQVAFTGRSFGDRVGCIGQAIRLGLCDAIGDYERFDNIATAVFNTIDINGCIGSKGNFKSRTIKRSAS